MPLAEASGAALKAVAELRAGASLYQLHRRKQAGQIVLQYVGPDGIANNADEVRLHAGNILGMDIKGHLVKRVWVEHASDISKEYYASYSLDRGAKKIGRAHV